VSYPWTAIFQVESWEKIHDKKNKTSRVVTFYHLSNEQKPGCSGYIGDEILPSSMGIAISHYKHPVMNQPVWWDIIIVLKF